MSSSRNSSSAKHLRNSATSTTSSTVDLNGHSPKLNSREWQNLRYGPSNETSPALLPQNQNNIMFRRSNSSRTKSSTLTSNSSTSGSPLHLLMHGDAGAVVSSRGNLVKKMVDNLYTNSAIAPYNNKNQQAHHSKTSQNPNKIITSTGLTDRTSTSIRGVNGMLSNIQGAMSPATQQRTFGSQSQSAKHEHNYDNLSPAEELSSKKEALPAASHSYNLPSLDRKSITRASLPIGSSNPYFPVRSGSGMSSASYTQQQQYGQINQLSTKDSTKPAFLDGDPIGPDVHCSIGKGKSIETATWVEILEPRSKAKMFANLSTGACLWEEPKEVKILRSTDPNITQWWELYDQKSQRFYYYSYKDFKTIWEKPTSPDAIVVPLAKLQILKHNTNHRSSNASLQPNLNDSFDSGTGGTGNSSTGHLTPSSPSLCSPSHAFSSKLKFGGVPLGPMASPVAPVLADASTQTQNPIQSKPTMVSRWTQTTNIMPTHVRMPRPLESASNISSTVPNVEQCTFSGAQRPSLHHYLLSEKRFALGRHSTYTPSSTQTQMPQEEIYDPVYNSNYGNLNDEFYDLVADGKLTVASRNDFYDDVYDDEFLEEDDDELGDNSSDEEFEDFDADDEFGGESVDEADEDNDEDDEDDECDFDESSEEEENREGVTSLHEPSHHPHHQHLQQYDQQMAIERQLRLQHNELEQYSAQDDFEEIFRGHPLRQPLVPVTRHSARNISQPDAVEKVSHNANEKPQLSSQTPQVSDGLRLSASFSASDFKRNVACRSSYNPSMQHYQPQPQQANLNGGQQHQQSYSNPFNSGSLRSSTGRIVSNNSGVVRSSGSPNIAERINLFNKKSSRPSPLVSKIQSSPSPLIIHRTPSSPPAVNNVSTQMQVNSEVRHSTGSGHESASVNNHLHGYFYQAHSPNSSPQQPSKSFSLTLISQQTSGLLQPNATSPNSTNFCNNITNLNIDCNKSSETSSSSYYYIPPSLSSENLPQNSITGSQKPKKIVISSKNIDSNNDSLQYSNMETTRSNNRTLSNTLGHSISVGGHGSKFSHISEDIQISNSTSAIYNQPRSLNAVSSFPNFDDSHLIMLNKSQSVATTSVPSSTSILHQSKGKENGNLKKKEKFNKGSKIKDTKNAKGSPKKSNNSLLALPNTSIESFAKECVSRHRKGGIFSKKKTLKSMLTHTKKPLKKPMISTISDALLVKESIKCFKLIQTFMGDRGPSNLSNIDETRDQPLRETPLVTCDEDLLVQLINVCVQLVPLRDEVLVQVARQVTQNPSVESEQRGLELMCVLFWYFTASNKLASHLHAFLASHRNAFTAVVRRKFEQQIHRARHTHSHLFFRKPHSTEEVARVLRCVRAKHAGLFGETLKEAIVASDGNDPKKQLPWPIVLLIEALLEPRHEDREGVFRCVGDMDDVHKLKMKIDTTLPTSQHFTESIGRDVVSRIGKLTDAHDIHVIASTLKLYFRELREAIIPAELYLDALECAHNPTKACGLLNRLGPINRNSLYYLISFLQIFSAPEHVCDTKMDDANLSMVWAPNILRSITPNPAILQGAGPNGALLAATANSANIYEQTRAEMSLMRTLIQHLDTSSVVAIGAARSSGDIRSMYKDNH